MGKQLLFVYGTLKRGHKNHHRIVDQEFVRAAVTEARYRLVDLGPYPGLIRDDDKGLSVKGEVWAVSRECLAELDDFEGFAYAREPVALMDAEGVESYFWIRPVPPLAPSGAEWPLVSS